jgi:hypothetical protein
MKQILRIFFILLIFLLSLSAISCEPGLSLEVHNQTDRTVNMSVSGISFFNVLPHSVKTGVTITTNYPPYFVEGVRENGEIVFSRYFTRADFKGTSLQGSTIEVTILPNEENPYLPLEIENRLSNDINVVIDGADIGSIKKGATISYRPLPNNLSVYPIKAIETYIGGKGYRVYHTVLDKTFSRDELEKQNWRIIISNP